MARTPPVEAPAAARCRRASLLSVPALPLHRLPAHPPRSRHLRVVIETPRGSRNKFAFDPDLERFELKGVLPEGSSFPYDFGFVPSTLGEDGDPLDVLVLMDAPAFPGCLVEARLLGALEAEQTDAGQQPERKTGSLPWPRTRASTNTCTRLATCRRNCCTKSSTFLPSTTPRKAANFGCCAGPTPTPRPSWCAKAWRLFRPKNPEPPSGCPGVSPNPLTDVLGPNAGSHHAAPKGCAARPTKQ